MIAGIKIDIGRRRISQIDDITDLATMLFPGDLNQQHAAPRGDYAS